MIFCLFCFLLFDTSPYVKPSTQCTMHTHTRAQNFHRISSLFVFLPLFDSFFFSRLVVVCVRPQIHRSRFSRFSLFFSLLPPPLHRLKPRQRTLTAKSIRSTKGRTFDDDTLLADSRGFLTTTTSEGRCSRGFCRLGEFSSVSVGWGVSIEGGEC